MSLSNQGASAIDKKLTTTGKTIRLNPDAAAFVPFALRSPSASVTAPDASSTFGNNFGATSTTPGKAVLDRSESSISNISDDEAHQYWRHQLPDDITPDFNVSGDEDLLHGINTLPFSSLSLTDVSETNGSSFIKKTGYPHHPLSSSSASFQPAKPWDIHDEPSYNADPVHGYLDDMLNEQQQMEGTEVNPLDFLASQFTGFAAESLADVYFANGGDLNLTIEMLTQLELQVDGGFNQNLNPKTLSSPNLTAMDFPALSPSDDQSQHGVQQHMNNTYRPLEKENLLMFKSSSGGGGGVATDFAAAVRKMASQDSSIWKYNSNSNSSSNRNPSQDSIIGSSRSSHVLASAYNNGGGRVSYGGGDRSGGRTSTRSAPVWLETGEAVGNMYSEMRGEARDHARLRNAYFEQARQAYLVGYKALAKELSVKGQLHNMQMKAAHGKAQESIYRQRNPVSPSMQGGRGGTQERLIDLHGLHVTEAIHVLKRDLTMLRNVARSADEHVQVYICVGTGHHTRGTRTPARLPVAIQRYLLEEEGLDYSEPQPGLLRVVIY